MYRKPTLIALFLALMLVTTIMADVPNIITYQGRLTNSLGQPETGSFPLTFSIYAAATGGTQLWTSGPQTVLVLSGMFTYELGSNSPLPPDIMTNSTRWLGVKVGSDAEMTPRTSLTSAAFAMHSLVADSVQNDIYVRNTGDTIEGNLSLTTSGTEHVRLSTSSTGSVRLFDSSDDMTAYWTSGSTTGAYGRLFNQNGQHGILFDVWTNGSSMFLKDDIGVTQFGVDTRSDGVGAITLPEGSIHSLDIANEPGIVGNDNGVGLPLNYSEMRDLTSVTITIPEDGYIWLVGNCYVRIASVPDDSMLFAGIQIDETIGGSYQPPYYQRTGRSEFTSTLTLREQLTTQRRYFKTAGTYTFFLEGDKSADLGSVVAWSCQLTAVYLPTSYGSVETIVSSSDATDFESPRIQIFEPDSHSDAESTETNYKVDLRELELRAARLRAETERAERELLEAQLRERDEQAQR